MHNDLRTTAVGIMENLESHFAAFRQELLSTLHQIAEVDREIDNMKATLHKVRVFCSDLGGKALPHELESDHVAMP